MSELYLNRELSWLEFDRRVLALAENRSWPLLERIKFLAIFARNLDEFFQVRVALLRAERDAGLEAPSPDGLTASQQLAGIRARVLDLVRAESQVFEKDLMPELARAGIRIAGWSDLGKKERKHLGRVFEEKIFPVVTPLAVDPAHPFPYISNLSFNLAVLVRHPGSRTARFARIKVPPLLGRFLPLPDGEVFVPIEQVLAAHLESLFPGMEIESRCAFRVTRDADLDLEEDAADDLMVAIESGLHRRERSSDAVRLEIDEEMNETTRDLLVEELELGEEDVYRRSGLLDLGSLWELYALERPDLKFEPWIPRSEVRPSLPEGEDGRDFFKLLRERDVLVHHPYDSFDASVQAFLEQAADDPHVLAIKHTIYRTAGPQTQNPIGSTLMRAAHAGKQVVTLVELKARFDEQTNIEWARTLEQAGVHVVYGLVGLKTHGKVALVVRQEGDELRRYCHVGTGNYNPITARSYEDLGLLTASPELGADLSELFNHLTGYSQHPEYRRALVAPERLRPALLGLIREEAEHDDGRIVIKCNSVSDPAMIDALYAASRAGVRIDLVVRGICCLRPAAPGLSERIRVRSIVGRYLEHSRIFRFGSEERGPRYFIGSADLMQRNLDRRVEVVVPIEDAALGRRLQEILDLLLADDGLAWELGADGAWTKVPVTADLRAQERLQELARERSRPS
jgi:polyphosphate kinase